ncbi:hypothetical protein ESCO_000241 [Escovopsis weberi]|uniref:Uncharacterized protein n=1 Tax=Escovopsis weberi TaxID=150374 RepID=A0A0M8N2X8_ESCWE|nr:hypothetical protein ESCO_000241 [Escovopsis weberi]
MIDPQLLAESAASPDPPAPATPSNPPFSPIEGTPMDTAPVTPSPAPASEMYPAPVMMGGFMLPGGNLVMPSASATVPATPAPAVSPLPIDPDAIRRKKEESDARDKRSIMARRKKPVNIFLPKKPEPASAQIRSPALAEREAAFRRSQGVGLCPQTPVKQTNILSPSQSREIMQAIGDKGVEDDWEPESPSVRKQRQFWSRKEVREPEDFVDVIKD